MIPTPDLSHLKPHDYDHVYEPAEDTFLLLDALEQDADELKALHPLICLEIGSGSGCVSCFAGSILGSRSTLFLCTDINSHASRCTTLTGIQNKVQLDAITASLDAPLASRLYHAVDLLLFNPPYVPTVDEEATDAQGTADLEGSWAGGTAGMQVTDLLLRNVEALLSDRGRFYLVAVTENDIPGIRRNMLETHGLRSDIVLQRRAGREHLFVLRFQR
ncbi:hypothetical protein PLICRDRAFT_402164 [Plicaturopsis crispa FD-325 SS-3]|nr:hypothetical protein PLICRDRAFT_402164 [Plicaturopsis crispa FD-325 SS-3]